jgi:sulfofructose kinase
MKRVLCIGHAVQDYVFRVPHLPQRAEKYRADGFTCAGGGPAATAAVAITRLGGAAQLVARVGADSIADAIEHELRSYGVDCQYLRRIDGCSSSISAVFVDAQGERMIVNHVDAQLTRDPAWLSQVDVTAADAVLADTRWPEGAAELLGHARRASKLAVLDADLPVPKEWDFLASATHIAFSRPGLCDFCGHDEFEQALRDVATRTGAWCCVTLGGDGVVYTANGQLAREPAFAVQPRDTLGAGDVWHGAFALALAEGVREPQAVRAASAAAAIKVSRVGGRAAIPTRAERDRLLEAQ